MALVLNSSQSKTPCGHDPWIAATNRAVQHLVSNGYGIISSLGLVTWELPIYLVSELGGNHVIFSPVFDEENGVRVFNNTLWEFDLNENNTAMIFLDNNPKSKSPKTNWAWRDKAALALAQVIAPVAIRPGGRLERLLIPDNETIIDKFRVDFGSPRSIPSRYDKTLATKTLPPWNHIAHWTRTRIGPWLGERKKDYFTRLLNSQDKYPGMAFDTLLNIIEEKRIRSSSEKIRDNTGVIGFSEATPAQVLNLMRWCPRQVNWNFEPYGIAIEREYAIQLGIKPVIYGSNSDYELLPDSDKPFFHGRGREKIDWSREQEWRHLGDLDISNIPRDKITYFVWQEREARILRNLVSGTVCAFCDN